MAHLLTRREAAAMQSERPWMESLVACIPDPLALVRADWTILWANREFAHAVGSAEGLKGRALTTVIERWEALAPGLIGQLPAAGRTTADVFLIRPDGDRQLARLHLARCHPGVDAAWAIHLHDGRELGELQRRLSERERSHSFLRANTSDLIIRVDEQLVISWSNDTAAQFFPPGMPLAAIVSPASIGSLTADGSTSEDARFDVAMNSIETHRPRFFLRGVARRLTGEDGKASGFSLLLHDDSQTGRVERFAAEWGLSPREAEVLEYLAKGFSNLNIASILGLSESGVKFHIRNVFARAKVSTRTELVALLLEDQADR